jgi:large subunit ribosomal protein L5
MAGLKDKYTNEILPKLQEQAGGRNRLACPRLEKVVVNMGMGIVDKDQMKAHVEELAAITGQRPVITKARKSISNFKLREGMSVGARVTLRGARMFDFLERLIHAALPRIRDFRGLSPDAFDGHGNYSMGMREQSTFPEIDPNHAGAVQGMDITIVTSAETDDEARELLRQLGMPLAKE